MSEEAIDIERFDNTVIQVDKGTPPVSVDETTLSDATIETTEETPSVFNFTRRIVIGVILLILLVIPIGFGMYMSWVLNGYVKDAVDPENIWPDSAYTGLTKEAVPLSNEYSFETNNFLPIKDDDGSNLVVEINAISYSHSHGHIMTKYRAAAYLIENIMGDKDLYGLCVVVKKDDNDNLKPTSFRPFKRLNSDEIVIEDHILQRTTTEVSVFADSINGPSYSSPYIWDAEDVSTLKAYISREFERYQHEGIQIFAVPSTTETKSPNIGYAKTLHEQRQRSLDQASMLLQNQRKNRDTSVFSGIPELKTV